MSRSALGGKQEPHGEGTRVAEYIETPVPRQCNKCEYFVGKKFCRQDVMMKDKEVPTDKSTGLKIINPINGCCRYWEPKDNDEDDK